MEKKSFFSGMAGGAIIVSLIFAVHSSFYIPKQQPQTQSNTTLIDEKLNAIASLLNKYYVETVDYQKMMEGVYAGLVDSLGDPYTTYMSKDELASFIQDTDGSFPGIGVEVTADSMDKGLLVIAPIDGSPAAKAGILPGDRIITIDGMDILGREFSDAIARIRGPEGSEIQISIFREEEKKLLDFTMKRSKIDVNSVKYEMLEDNIGYIKISQFNKNTDTQFIEAYHTLNKQGQRGLIIDVRNNPGGLLKVVERIADILVPEGTLVYTIDKNGNRKDSVSDKEHIEIPLVLLVNQNSASASEILAGAVQDMGVGKLVGTQTFGKGLVQGLYTLQDGSGVKITIQKYYTPRGVCIQGEGITPDFIVELPEELKNSIFIDRTQDSQFQKAVEVIQQQMTQ